MPYLTNRRSLLATLAAPLIGCRQSSTRSNFGAVAFSLRQAESLVRAGHQSVELSSLAGVNRFLGLIHDTASNDIVLVGRAVRGAAPLQLDDLAAAIQARVVKHEWPLVSIDRNPDTARTGLQRVRWEGGVSGSSFGAKLLAADITLKKAALGLPPVDRLPFQSYFDLCSAQASAGKLAPNSSRFWFHAADAALLSRESVFILQKLSVGVEALVVAGKTGKDEIADRYAAEFTRNLDTLSERQPEIAQLQPLFATVAIAHGIESLPPRLHEFWARRYAVAPVQTAAEYPVMRRQVQVKAEGRETSLELSGGVDTRIFVQRLKDRDHIAFQEAVLKTRPASDALSWNVPLGAWDGQGEAGNSEIRMLAAMPGTTIDRNVSPPSQGFQLPNRGGVYADVPVGDKDFAKK